MSGIVVETYFDGSVRHEVARFSATLVGGFAAPVTACGQYGRQGDPTERMTVPAVSCERCRPPMVQYPADVCADHEYGSDWPCRECGH